MSAPDTNIEKQKREHRAPLWGMWAGLGLVAVLFLAWMGYVVGNGDTPGAEGEGLDAPAVTAPAN